MSPFTPNNSSARDILDDMSASFRDPDGSVVSSGDRIFRVLRRGAESGILDFLQSPLATALVDEGRLVGTRVLSPDDHKDLPPAACAFLEQLGGGSALEHERVPFVSFPYEWPPEMLHAAASLTLDLAEQCLDYGFGLKDATPYNVLFRGVKPVFVDISSFEGREPGDPTWLAYAQFVRTFLLPLAVAKHYALRLDQILIPRRDGLEAEEVYGLLKLRHKLRPMFLTLVSIPTWLGARVEKSGPEIYRKRILKQPEKAQFILSTVFAGLRRNLRRVEPELGKTSIWSEYGKGATSYSVAQSEAKRVFVEQALTEYRPKRVLDVGCNTGYFSLLAAGEGSSVVAIDRDPVVVGETWRLAASEGASVLPLVVDLCRPTPAMGWCNRECPSFLDRARGSFDAVLMLAVIHHMMITERIPLDSILRLAADLTTDLLVIEFVGPEDRMFRKLLRGRDELHQGVTNEVFKSKCTEFFEILRSQRLEEADRWIYLLRRK